MHDKTFMHLSKTLFPQPCYGIYTVAVHKLTTEFSQNELQCYLHDMGININSQTSLTEYVTGICTEKTICTNNTSFTYKSNDDYKLIFYDLESLKNLFVEKTLYVFKPMYCKILGNRHIIMIIIDKQHKTIQLFDSNCCVNILSLIEKTFRQIISDYNSQYNDNYQVICTIYNGLYKLNKYKSLNIDGLCVALSLLISQYIYLTNCTLDHTIKKFTSLTDIQMMSLIKMHSLIYYVKFHNV